MKMVQNWKKSTQLALRARKICQEGQESPQKDEGLQRRGEGAAYREEG